MSRHDVALLPAFRQRQLIHNRQLSPVELLHACQRHVERFNGRINALVTLSDQAEEEARRAEKLAASANPPLLCGLPVGIKDVTEVGGLLTTYGSTLYAENVPAQDALVVERLRAAGAVILGKTNTPEFATGGNTFNEVFGRTRNPWDPDRSAGGSTGGGAAALATGMISLAQGTDLGGSLRIPASFCGVAGLRPSPGLVPTWPSDYLWDTMQVTGPMARRIEDVALMLQAVSGPSRRSPIQQPFRGRDFVAAAKRGGRADARIAYCPDIASIGVDTEIEKVCREVALRASKRTSEIQLDLSFGWKPFLSIRGMWMVTQQFSRLDRLQKFGENLAGNVRAGLKTSMHDLAAAEEARGRLWELFNSFFQQYDYLLTPSMAVPPFPVEENYPREIAGRKMESYVDWIAPTFILSLTGLPVASVPCGLDPRGLPVGLQIVGPPQGEEKVLGLAAEIQETHPIGRPAILDDV